MDKLTVEYLVKFQKDAQESALKAIRGTIKELCTSIIDDTPVGDPDLWNISDEERARIKASGYVGGNLKNNWMSTPSPTTETVEQPDRNASRALGMLDSELAAMKLGGDFYFSNRLPYAYGIEMGVEGPFAGRQLQAPQGMMRKNLIRFDSILERKAKEA